MATRARSQRYTYDEYLKNYFPSDISKINPIRNPREYGRQVAQDIYREVLKQAQKV